VVNVSELTEPCFLLFVVGFFLWGTGVSGSEEFNRDSGTRGGANYTYVCFLFCLWFTECVAMSFLKKKNIYKTPHKNKIHKSNVVAQKPIIFFSR